MHKVFWNHDFFNIEVIKGIFIFIFSPMKQHCVSDFVDLKIFGVFILNNFFF